MFNVLQELKEIVDKDDNNFSDKNKQYLRSLKIINEELKKIRDLNAQLPKASPSPTQTEPTATWFRKIKSRIELKFYQQLLKTPMRGFPEIIDIKGNIVEMKKYILLESDNLTPKNIRLILRTLETIKNLGYSHRAVHNFHLMYDTSLEIPVLVDYGKMTELGKKSHLFSRNSVFLSRNAMLQNPCAPMDDLESFGYCLVYFLCNFKIFNTYEEKTEFIRKNIRNCRPEIEQYFDLIKINCSDFSQYISLF